MLRLSSIKHSLLSRPLASALVLLLGLLLYVLFVGFSLDTPRLRDKAASLLTQSLGREVRFDGPLQLQLSAHPGLQVNGLHVANAPGYPGAEFAGMGEARLKLNLWSLLQGRLQVENLSGRDVRLTLQMNAQGVGNWQFSSPGKQPAAVPSQQAGDRNLGSLLARFDIRQVSLQNLEVEFTGADAQRHYFELQSLSARFPAGKPARLSMHGLVEKRYPYEVDLIGGTLAQLAQADQPWPVEMVLSFMHSRMALNGSVSGSSGDLLFGVGTEHLEEFEQMFQVSVPTVGGASITAMVRYGPGRVELEGINAALGETMLNGTLYFDYGGGQPVVRGGLSIPELDLHPFLTRQASAPSRPHQSFAAVYRDLSRAKFDLGHLQDMDADLSLQVGQWRGLPGEVHDATLRVQLERGHLAMPVQLTLAGVTLSGNVGVDASTTPASFHMELGTRQSELGGLAGLLTGMSDVRGHLGRFDLRAIARGDSGAALMDSLELRLALQQARLSYGHGAGERPVAFTLDKLSTTLSAAKGLRGEAGGNLLGSEVNVVLRGGSLADLVGQTGFPLDLELHAGSASAQASAMLDTAQQGLAGSADIMLDAPHTREIAGWFGLASSADVPLHLRGGFRSDAGGWQLSGLMLRLGRSALHADVRRVLEAGKPLLKLNLDSERIDVAELQTLLPRSSRNTETAASLIDIPILPGGLNLADADIAVRIGELASASPLSVNDVHFDGRIRDGMMDTSPFGANAGGQDFTGAIMLDLRALQPHAVLWVSADALDVGALLGRLGIVTGMEAGFGHLSLRLDLRASRLGQMLEQSAMLADIEGGRLVLRDANTGGAMHIALDRGTLTSRLGAPLFLEVSGSMDGVPVSIQVETARAVDLLDPALSIPFKVNANTAAVALQWSGSVERPFSSRQAGFELAMSGASLADLSGLLRTSLPPWGPWSVTGTFRTPPDGYEVSAMQLQVGSSQLNGSGSIDTKAVPPRLEVALHSPIIQLDDFPFGGWSAEGAAVPVVSAKPLDSRAIRRKAGEASEKIQHVLSPEALRRQDAHLVVRVDQVVSGADELGSGTLEAKLEHGRADIGPVQVNMPGGSAAFSLGYQPDEGKVAMDLHARVRHFDYGVLARRFAPGSNMQGDFSLGLDVGARAPSLAELLRYGSGRIDFAAWPKNFRAGRLDMWAVNALMALLPEVDPDKASRVNCAVGRFELDEGKLSDKALLIDTSRMRVTGKAMVDFGSEQIDLYAQPRAKTPQFLSFALPVELSGSFHLRTCAPFINFVRKHAVHWPGAQAHPTNLRTIH